VRSEDSELMKQIAKGDWDDSIEERLGTHIADAIDDFGPDFDAEGNPLEEGESDRILSEEQREKGGRTAEADGSGDEDGDEEAEAGDSEAEAEEREEEEAATT